MSEAHNTNHKSDSSEEPDDEHNVTTVKSVPAANAAHTFSIIPAKSVVVVATEKPAAAIVSETINRTAAPEMIHSTPLTATLVISTSNNSTDHIQSVETTTVKPAASTTSPTSSTQKPALVFAETTANKTAPIAVAAHIITATPMVIEEVISMKPAMILNATEKSANVSVETVSSKPAVTTAMPMAPTTATTAEHSTEKPTVHVVQEMPMAPTTATIAMNSTEKPAHVTEEIMPSTAVPAISTEKLPTHVTEEMNKTAEATTIKTTSSMPTVVTSAAASTTIRREKRQADNMTTKKPVATTKKAIPTTKKPLVPTTPVFGRRVSTRAPIPVTRRARQGTTIRPSAMASRASTIKPVNPTTKQPVKLSPMPSNNNVHTPVTTKPHPAVPTGSVTPKA